MCHRESWHISCYVVLHHDLLLFYYTNDGSIYIVIRSCQTITDVHLSLLQEGFAFSHCTECRAVFILRANVPPDRWWLRLKFQLLVARDHAFIFVIVQLVRRPFIFCSHLSDGISPFLCCLSSAKIVLFITHI